MTVKTTWTPSNELLRDMIEALTMATTASPVIQPGMIFSLDGTTWYEVDENGTRILAEPPSAGGAPSNKKNE